MSCKVLLLAVAIAVAIFIATGGCLMFFTNIFGWKDKGKVDPMNATESTPDFDDDGSSMSSETVVILTPDEDGKIDGMFPDFMEDDLKLILILKALDLLKALEGEKPDYVSTLLPSSDEMTDELKLRLILKAILLLDEKPLTSMFAGHVVAELKLTLLLKAISFLKDVPEDVESNDQLGLRDLQLNLVRKALYILKRYRGDFEDTVFNTKSRSHLKLKLILLSLTLSKTTSRRARDVNNFWPIGHGKIDDDSQSQPTMRVTIDNGGLVPDEVTTPKPTGPEEREIPDFKKKGLKVFKWLKWLSKIPHKKGH